MPGTDSPGTSSSAAGLGFEPREAVILACFQGKRTRPLCDPARAVDRGFEPRRLLHPPAFETGALGRCANPPEQRVRDSNSRGDGYPTSFPGWRHRPLGELSRAERGRFELPRGWLPNVISSDAP